MQEKFAEQAHALSTLPALIYSVIPIYVHYLEQ